MVRKWDIYLCSLDPTVGSEQRGMRPVLVVSSNAINNNLPVSTILPISSLHQSDRIYPSEVILEISVTGLSKRSVAMIQQIRTVSHNRLVKLVGAINDTLTQEKITNALLSYFDL